MESLRIRVFAPDGHFVLTYCIPMVPVRPDLDRLTGLLHRDVARAMPEPACSPLCRADASEAWPASRCACHSACKKGADARRGVQLQCLAGAMDEIQELSNATCMARAPIVRIDVAGTKIDVFFVPVLFV